MSTNLWDFVNKYPYNPHIWTELVLAAEETQNFDAIVKAYNGFLKQFPLMHIYWNKLALLVRTKTSSSREASSVFIEALKNKSLQNSVDFWFLYCDFMSSHSAEFTELDIRSVFEKALESVGNDFNSDAIWSLYISWEQTRGNTKQASLLFARVLSTPVRNLEEFWKSFIKHAEEHPMEDCVTAEEKANIEKQVSETVDQKDLSTAQAIDRERKELTLSLRKEKYIETVTKQRTFLIYEMRIKRTYFHFKLPDAEQVANWNEYINCVEATGDVELTKHIFERCLIPCNLSADLWMKYALFVQASEGNEAAIEVMDRAAETALCASPSYYRQRGVFFEILKDEENAAKAYDKLQEFQTAEAVISLALYRRRVGIPYDEDLMRYYKGTKNQREIACIGALLFKLHDDVDYVDLLERAPREVLALSTAVAFLEMKREDDTEEAIKERIKTAKEAFIKFISSRANVYDRITANEAFLTFLSKHAAPLGEIRKAQRQQITLEKEGRLNLLKQRREEAKNTTDLSDVLDRWMLYIQENDKISASSE